MSAEIDSIITAAVQDSESSTDVGGETAESSTDVSESSSYETSAESTDAAPVAEPTPAAEPDELATELGVKPGREKQQRIPYDRVKAIIAKQREKAAAEIRQQYARYEAPDFQNELRAIELARTNPTAFYQALSQTPEFQQYMRAQEPPPQPQPQQRVEEEPAPDIMLNDGTMTYSAQRLTELRKWEKAQIQKDIDAKLAPLGEIQRERQMEVQWRDALDRQRNVVAEARAQWPGFKENEAAIRDALNRDDSLSLDAAYRQVVMPSFKADRDRMRAEILAEMNRKPAAASGVVPGSSSPSSSRDSSIESIIRDAVRSSNRAA